VIRKKQVLVEEQEFAQSKNEGGSIHTGISSSGEDGFMNVPDGIDEELPFH